MKLRFPPVAVRSVERVNEETTKRRREDEADARERADVRRELDELREQARNLHEAW
jgi:hypothetical protein